MKKNNVISYAFIIGLFLIIGFLSIWFLVKPGVINIKNASKMEIASNEEMIVLLKEVEDKYVLLYAQLDDKYALLLEEHEAKYNKIEAEIEAKYQILIDEVEAKYDLPMTHRSWYENKVKANKEISVLQSQMRDEINEKTSGKGEEWLRIHSNKSDEENLIHKNKSIEENDINNRAANKTSIIFKGIMLVVIGFLIMLLYILYVLRTYNKLTKLNNKVKESWSGIEILLKRRFDLLPNFIKTVKGYASHEKETFKEVTKARSSYDKAETKEEEMIASKTIEKSLSRLIMLGEDYPELKANKNFLSLQEELKNTEDLIAGAREIYNRSVLMYKNVLHTFPSNTIASIFKFKDEEYFDIDESEKENINVKNQIEN